MGLFNRKPKSSDWKITGSLPDGRAVAVDSNGNSRTYAPGGEIITYDKKGTVISRTIGSQPGGPGSSDDHSSPVPTPSQRPQKIDQIKTDGQQPATSQVSYSPVTTSTGSSSGQSNAVVPNRPEPQKPKVEFRTADNGDLLQRAEGGNWYVAKDNPDPLSTNDVKSSSQGLNKKYHLGDYASPTASDALGSRSEGMNKEHGLGDYSSKKSSSTTEWKTALEVRSEGMNEVKKLGDYSTGEASGAPAWHANQNWTSPDQSLVSEAGLTTNRNKGPHVLEQRPERAGGSTIFRMSDGTYQAYSPKTGQLHNVGTWDSSQWPGSEFASSSPAPQASPAAPASVPTPQPTEAAYNPGDVDPSNLTRQWVAEHRDEPASVSARSVPQASPAVTESHTPTEPAYVPTAQELVTGYGESAQTSQPQSVSSSSTSSSTTSYSPADQYSGNVDMAEIERSVAEYTKSQTPAITLPSPSDTDPAGVAGLDSSTGGDYLNPGRLAGHGRHYAE